MLHFAVESLCESLILGISKDRESCHFFRYLYHLIVEVNDIIRYAWINYAIK